MSNTRQSTSPPVSYTYKVILNALASEKGNNGNQELFLSFVVPNMKLENETEIIPEVSHFYRQPFRLVCWMSLNSYEILSATIFILLYKHHFVNI